MKAIAHTLLFFIFSGVLFGQSACHSKLLINKYSFTVFYVSLRARVERANTWCRQLGKKNVCLVSIHTNAAGNGRQWMTARGWCCYTSRGQTAGDRLAACLYEAVSPYLPGHKLRKDYSDGDPDWESDFTILRNTLCTNALSENLSHDNADDLAFLESAPGRQAIIDLHVRGIISFVNAYSKWNQYICIPNAIALWIR